MRKYLDEEVPDSHRITECGLFMHHILEEYEKGNMQLDELVPYYEENFDKQVVSTMRLQMSETFSKDMYGLYYNDCLEYLKNFTGIPNCKTIVDVEKEFHLPYNDYSITGKIDLIFRDNDNKLIVLDHKSKKKFKSKKDQAHYARQLYLYAWEKGLKGVTIFRDGCKRTGILTTSDKSDDEKNTENDVKSSQKLERGMIIKADDNCIGKKRTLHTGCGTLHCEAFFDPDTGDLLETYFSKGSSGGCNNFMIGLSRQISLAARGGIDIYSIVDQLKSSGTCPSYAVRTATKHDTSKGSSCPVAIGNALLEMYEEMQDELSEDDDDSSEDKTVKNNSDVKEISNKKQNANEYYLEKCPECGAKLIHAGGCVQCSECAWSKCI